MNELQLLFLKVLHTNGEGYWSDQTRPVHHTYMKIPYMNDEGDFGELRVFFKTKSWDTHKHGLIYTDPQWIHEFHNEIVKMGFSRAAATNADYSEQGMQGYDYVSLDIGATFYEEMLRLHSADKK